MKLYIISQTPRGENSGFFNAADCLMEIVVRAEDETQARAMAVERSGDEPDHYWTDPAFSFCEELDADGPAEVICRDYWEA